MQNEDKKTYITLQGHKDLKKELELLRTEKRQEIAERIAQAKELGDLSENAEYTEAKEAQGFNEGRILELEAIIKHAIIIEEEDRPEGIVSVGSKIVIKEDSKNKKGETKEYHIVGSHEANPSKGKISNQSPIGQALLGSKVGDVVEIKLPKGTICCEIVDVK